MRDWWGSGRGVVGEIKKGSVEREGKLGGKERRRGRRKKSKRRKREGSVEAWKERERRRKRKE